MSFVYALATALTLAAPVEAPAAAPVLQEKDSVTRIIERVSIRKATSSIVNRQKAAALLLLDSTIVLQMTDEGLKDLGKESDNGKPSGMPKLLEKMLLGSVKALLDHGIEYSLSDLKDARVENGVLVLESKSGDRIFEGVKINDDKVLETFSAADARRFAAQVNRAKRRH